MTTDVTNASTATFSKGTGAYIEKTFFGHFIDGAGVPSISEETMPVIDPSTEQEFARAAAGDAQDVDRAVVSARAAFDDGRWRNLAPLEKERRLRKLSALVAENAETFGDLDALDAGLLRSYTKFLEAFAVDAIDYFAGWPTKLTGSIPPVPVEFSVSEVREPVGVLALIVPWNGPTAVIGFVAAALATGNSVILKPAENTPTSAFLMGQLASEAGIPDGVFNVVQGTGRAVGAALVEHPGVDAISFTGSVATGRAIQVAAASSLKRVSLELGGKSPVIVFGDADLDAAAAAAAGSVWGGQGQVCTAGTRVLAHRSIHDELVSKMVESSKQIRMGNAFDPEAGMGPLVSAAQLDRVSNYVDIGRQEGADVALAGGRWGERGYFHSPVIFTSVRNEMRIAQEEIFGPVMSVLSFDTEDDALRIANDVEYGLAAGVFTNDVSRAQRVSRALRAGTVWVNSYQMVYPSVAYGGVKQSGYGRTLGEEMVKELTNVKSVWTAVSSQ